MASTALAVGAALLCAAGPAPVLDAAPPPPATANTTGLTIASVGTATLTVPGGGSAPYSATSSSTVTGKLPATVVTDVRPLGGAWTVTVSANAFKHGANPAVTVPASAAKLYLAGATVAAVRTTLLGLGSVGATVNTATLQSANVHLGTPYTLLSGTTGMLGGTVIYEPTMVVVVPAATPAGTYTAVVTQTVS